MTPIIRFATSAIIAAALFVGASLLDTSQRQASQNEVSTMFTIVNTAQQPADEMMRMLRRWGSQNTISDDDSSALSAMRAGIDRRISTLLALDCRTGACERARRILLRELRNSISLSIVMSECAIMRNSPLMLDSGDKQCHSYAGPEILKDIENDRTQLNRILSNAGDYAGMPAPSPAAAFSGASISRKPNIVVILVDTLRADRVASAGAYMPFLDSLAPLGVYYPETRAQAPVTHLSIASMLTSRFPYTSGLTGDDDVWNNHLSQVETFRRAGYDTAAFSANYLIAPETGFGYGFNTFISRHWTNAEALNQAVFSWIETNETKGRNFFLYIHTVDPHAPYISPYEAERIIKEQNEPLWSESVSPNTLFNKYISQGKPVPEDIAAEAKLRLIRNYNAEVRYTDEQLEALIGFLTSHRLMRNTVVVVVSDHGEAFLEHGDVEHTRNVYDELTRVPLLFYGGIFSPASTPVENRLAPGHFRPEPPDIRANLIDVMPTLLDAAGIDIPPGCQGRSLLRKRPQLPSYSMTTMGFDVPEAKTRQTIYSSVFGGLKLVRNETLGKRELYDLVADPGETKNIYDPGDTLANALDTKLSLWVAATKQRGNLEAESRPSEGGGSIARREALEQKNAPQKRKKTGRAAKPATQNREMQQRLKSLGYVK